MLIFLTYVVFVCLVGAAAKSRGRSFIAWSLLSLVISPILSFIVLLCFRNKARSASDRLGVQESIRVHALDLQYGHLIKRRKPIFRYKSFYEISFAGKKRRFANKQEALAFAAAAHGATEMQTVISAPLPQLIA